MIISTYLTYLFTMIPLRALSVVSPNPTESESLRIYFYFTFTYLFLIVAYILQ